MFVVRIVGCLNELIGVRCFVRIVMCLDELGDLRCLL